IESKVSQSWINSVLNQNPTGVDYYVSAGAFNRGGKPTEALQQIKRSLNVMSLWYTRELNYYQLAIAHSRLGNRDEAHHWFGLAESLRASKFDHRPPELPHNWDVNDLMETEIYRREARNLLASASQVQRQEALEAEL